MKATPIEPIEHDVPTLIGWSRAMAISLRAAVGPGVGRIAVRMVMPCPAPRLPEELRA